MNDAAPIREELLDVLLQGRPAVERCRVTRIELAPGQATGRHTHPCDVVGLIVSGQVRFQLDGEDGLRLAAGDAFHEPAGVVVPHFDNASATEPAVFVACYLLPEGEERVIEMLPADA